MNIETQFGVVHAVKKLLTGKGFRSYRTVCSGNILQGRNVEVTDKPVNCATCRRRLERQAEIKAAETAG